MMVEEKTKNGWLHTCGIPIAHAFLWIIGLMVTTDFLNIINSCVIQEHVKLAISLGTVIIIFFLEEILTFIDCALEQKNQVLNITFCYYVALLFLITVLIVAFMFGGCYYNSKIDTYYLGKISIGIVILLSAFTKGMEIWLQNNWSVYTLNPKMPIISFQRTE